MNDITKDWAEKGILHHPLQDYFDSFKANPTTSHLMLLQKSKQLSNFDVRLDRLISAWK